MQKIIFHIDLDAFFCGCEEVVNPKLKNKPFIVGGRNKRSVVSSANYIARKYGIKAGKPTYMAQQLCPQVIVLSGNYKLYEDMSMQFFAYIKKHFTNVCEEMSIDECFLDVTNILKHYKNDPILLAKTIQNHVARDLKLSVSIGISYNKFLAKMATDLNKPKGITTVLTQDEIKAKIWPLDINDMYFIGPSTAEHLRAIKINKIGDLANYQDLELLKDVLGKNWYDAWQNANGISDDFVDTSKNDPKSLSVSHTLLDPTNNIEELETTFKYIAQELADKLEAYNMGGCVVSINYKINHVNYTRSEKQNRLIHDVGDLYTIGLRLLGRNYDGTELIQLIGLGLSKLVKLDSNLSLDREIIPTRKNKFQQLAQEVNKKLGQDLVFVAKDKLT